MHAYAFPEHEREAAALARDCRLHADFRESRGEPAGEVRRARRYRRGRRLSLAAAPPLRRSRGQSARDARHGATPFVHAVLGRADLGQSVQGQGRNPVGPAGGVVGAVRDGAASPASAKIIGFDMGGTSTDVCHFDGVYERSFESVVAGVRVRAPMMLIHTVAAGGGSILHYDGARFRVGPDSAGADPGPALLSARRAAHRHRRQRDDRQAAARVLSRDLRARRRTSRSTRRPCARRSRRSPARSATAARAEEIADGFIRIAVENMANAIKTISVQRGYDVTDYVLNAFGGAGGQHACLVADALGIESVLIHPLVRRAVGLRHGARLDSAPRAPQPC